jgi:hypothetical protein
MPDINGKAVDFMFIKVGEVKSPESPSSRGLHITSLV